MMICSCDECTSVYFYPDISWRTTDPPLQTEHEDPAAQRRITDFQHSPNLEVCISHVLALPTSYDRRVEVPEEAG